MRTTAFLGGNVTGGGVDQILPRPSDPRLQERHATDARDYVALAERMNGMIRRPVPMPWPPWGDALPLLDDLAPDMRIVNPETRVTVRGGPTAREGIHLPDTPRECRRQAHIARCG
ncbi:MAG TPA: hypothetical protein VE442_23250 [Jatrophihabitans sp.]|jgi:poly-gamma-glutamate synthesis protein (capsule biosynthesis protein)|nr:hypothetical protein [Jatrophihabitans sp.]